AARHQQLPPIPSLRLILISGARWTHDDTPALQALFPAARILCFYGASETSYISWMPACPGTPTSAVGRPFSNVQLHIGPDPRQAPLPPGQPGLIWVKSPMIFRDYIDNGDGTAATRIGDWISVRDIGHLDEDGILHLDGRENRMIVSQARNIFPEEIESCLARHPDIAHASVHGMPDPVRGQGVHAVLCLKPATPQAAPIASATDQPAPHAIAEAGASTALPDTPPPPPPDELSARTNPAELIAWCRQHLETWKTPRHWWIWQGPWPLTGSGKTDHGRIGAALREYLENKTFTAKNSTSIPESKTFAQNPSPQATDPAPIKNLDIKPLIKPLQEAMTTPHQQADEIPVKTHARRHVVSTDQ
ncbi:MAG: fatty acid--CoA ligase family protein, partial [Lautropia sp.]|nr:fatty acid--CoA ligase family protein [Lautropia sp.]